MTPSAAEAPLRLRPVDLRPTPCKVCGAPAPLFGVQDFNRSCEELRGRFLPLAGVQVAKEQYIDGSPMTSEEKAAAERSLQRFARGIYEKKIKPAEEQITSPVRGSIRR